MEFSSKVLCSCGKIKCQNEGHKMLKKALTLKAVNCFSNCFLSLSSPNIDLFFFHRDLNENLRD